MKVTILNQFASVVTLLALMGSATAFAQQGNKPNVVFILADNVGYGDLGSYGGGELRGAPTPRIDALAHEGLRLTQFLVEPACTPSRAALMTGQYSIRNGLSLIAIEGSPNTFCQRLHDGRVVQECRLRHRDFRQVAPWKCTRKACRPRTALTSSTASRRISAGTRQHMSTQSS